MDHIFWFGHGLNLVQEEDIRCSKSLSQITAHFNYKHYCTINSAMVSVCPNGKLSDKRSNIIIYLLKFGCVH